MDDPPTRRLRPAGQFPLNLPCVRLAVLAGLIGFTIAARCMAGWPFALDLLLMQGCATAAITIGTTSLQNI